MKKIKSGKEEIIYLLTKAIEQFKVETGQEIILNTNRKNYEALAIRLSEISNQLPFNANEWGTENYTPELNKKEQQYPYRKYDITGGQIKDALSGIVANPRPFLVDACYVYLFGVGRKAFELQPFDDNLLEKSSEERQTDHVIQSEGIQKLHEQIAFLGHQNKKNSQKARALLVVSVILGCSLFTLYYLLNKRLSNWNTLKADMSILPYEPTKAEIDSLEGIWLCYTGSPQARVSDPNRYHKVVPNLVEIKYKDGYFTFDRYGASFDHVGYMQFESPGIVSVYSRIKNATGKIESPRHSLFNLNNNSKYITAISASWNFDVDEKNKIIGIREVYKKLGKGGKIEEILNEVENASCQCKVIRWYQPNNGVRKFYLKNELLDSIAFKEMIPLINEKSILLSEPQKGLIISKDTSK